MQGNGDYISCEALVARIRYHIEKAKFCGLENHEATQLLTEAADALEQIPAADVRPVVTCADCKFWGRERISCEGLARCNTGESGIRYRNRNDFCSRGAMMEES